MMRWGKKRNVAIDLTPKTRATLPRVRVLLKVGGRAILLVAALLAMSLALYYYHKYRALERTVSVPNGEDAQTMLVNEVSKIVDLPRGEVPVIAMVNNVAALRSRAFFVNAQKGDQFLIYCVAKKALLYRPSSQRIIEFASIVPPEMCPAEGAKQ